MISLVSRCVFLSAHDERDGNIFFFFNDPATTKIYTLSLHDALPIYLYTRCSYTRARSGSRIIRHPLTGGRSTPTPAKDRKSTRLNSSHITISYAVYCLKKKKNMTAPSVRNSIT